MAEFSKYMTLAEAAEWSGFKENTIRRRWREGRIDGVLQGKQLLISRQSMMEYTQQGGLHVPHAEHTRNRHQKLTELIGGLDLPETVIEEEPKQDPPHVEVPELEFHDVDPVSVALIDTAWQLFAQAAELLVKAGHHAKEMEENDDRKVS